MANSSQPLEYRCDEDHTGLAANSGYDGYRWGRIPGVPGAHASTGGQIAAGERLLVARYLPGDGIYVPIQPSYSPEPIWLPRAILVAVTHLKRRPQYSWFDICSYTSALVEHVNGDEVDDRVVNLQWTKEPGEVDYEALMRVPNYYRPKRNGRP